MRWMIASAEPKIARLDSRALVRVAGPDAESFLQGLLTQNVEGMTAGLDLVFAAMLTPQGKLLFDLFVGADEAGLLLDVAAQRRDALVQRLSMYRLRAKVEIGAIEGGVFAAWAPGGDLHWTWGEPLLWAPDPRLIDLGVRIYGGEGETGASEDDYEAWRLSLGVPDPARDAQADKTFPIEANFDLLNGIDFRKGCFVGQETTSRMKRRGQIKNRMLPIAFEGPAPEPGAELLAGTLRAGDVLTGREGRAMALVRLDRIEGQDLTVDGRPVTVHRPHWFEG